MKKIIMVLENGEEILCGYALNIYKYFLGLNKIYVPLNGDRKYSFIRNIYNEELNQFVSYKSIINDE